MSLELDIIRTVQDWFSDPLAREFIIICARWLIFVLGIGALFAWRAGWIERHAMVEIAWSTLLAALIAFSAQMLIGRARPFITDPTLTVFVPRPHTLSFPSAHASIAYAIALAMLGWNTRLGVVAVIFADLIILGRVAAGVHYPTDVAAGVFVGALSFTVVRLGHYWVKSRK